MKKKIKYAIPPTTDQGPVTIIGTASATETPAQNALWQYNKMREHDGQSPLRRLPNGTKALRMTKEVYEIQVDYGRGLELVCAEDSITEARKRRAEYIQNDKFAQRVIIKRKRIPV